MAIQKYFFTATESVQGDTYKGYVYADAGFYFDLPFTLSQTDEAGGHWSYQITSHVDASSNPNAHSGYVYVTDYFDAPPSVISGNGIGILRTDPDANPTTGDANPFGTQYLGSEVGYASFLYGFAPYNFESTPDRFGAGKYVADPVRLDKDYFYAVESNSGDIIQGYVYDSFGYSINISTGATRSSKYHVGDSFSYTSETGGQWTYHIYDQKSGGDGGTDGQVFDTHYYDGQTKSWGDTLYGAHGTASGTHGIGSDYDYVSFFDSNLGPSSYDLFGSNGYYEAEKVYSGMQKYSFYAVESKSGDIIQGYTFDNTGKYSVGYSQTLATDEAGGSWTYHVYQSEDARTLGPSFAGRTYDTAYYDAETKSWAGTYYGSNGAVSGSAGIGSDYDYAIFTDQNGKPATPADFHSQAFGSGGYYVAENVALQQFNFYAVESKTGDIIAGHTFAPGGAYSDGFTKSFNDETGGTWTYHVTDHVVAATGAVSGAVFDTHYYNAETHEWGSTLYGNAGQASGTNGIGSDYDYAVFYDAQGHSLTPNYAAQLFGSGYYVADHII